MKNAEISLVVILIGLLIGLVKSVFGSNWPNIKYSLTSWLVFLKDYTVSKQKRLFKAFKTIVKSA